MKKKIRGFAIAMVAWCLIAAAAVGQDRTRPHKFLCVDALHEGNSATVVETATAGVNCHTAATSKAFLDKREAPEVHVYNRKFLTDYNVEITGVTTPQVAVIRGIEEAANLTLGTPSLIAPPAKGGLNALNPTTAATILQQLLDETQVNKPASQLESDYQELVREGNQIQLALHGLEGQFALLVSARPGVLDCTAIGGAPDFADVSSCLETELRLDTHDKWGLEKEHYGDENEFRVINIRAKYLLEVMGALQSAITSANLATAAISLDTDLTQFEKNVATFEANVREIKTAISLYEELKERKRVRLDLRGDQLRVYFTNQFKAAAADGTAVVDQAEINKLVNEVLDFLDKRGFDIANAQVAALASCPALERAEMPRSIATDVRSRLTALEGNLNTTVPVMIAGINALQSQLVERLNYIYDRSAVTEALVKEIDLSGYSGNLVVYYKIHRVENFKRYAVVTPVVGNVGGAAGNALVMALPPPAAPAAASGVAPASSTTSTTASTAAAAAPVAPPPGDVVAQGSFELHEFDRATVVAGFVFSRLHNNSFTAQPTTSNGKTTYTAAMSSQPFQPHVFIGVDYYFSPKDTFPTRNRSYHLKLSDFGLLGGVSANALNNYFVGLAWEPSLGFNFGLGAHSGTETRLQAPYQVNSSIPSSTVPTYDKRVTRLFVMAGFDLQIFRKIFGKVTGVGTSATSTGGSQ
jgi:hypothetical protein